MSWEGEGLASEGSESRGEDCILQPAVINKSCLETVDVSACNVGTDVTLTGMETLTMVVEYPGEMSRHSIVFTFPIHFLKTIGENRYFFWTQL